MKLFKLLFILPVIISNLSWGQSFSTAAGGAIPDPNPVVQRCFDIVVTGIGTLDGTNMALTTLCLDITHTFDADLDIILVSPSGTQVEVTTDNGGAGDNYTGTCFSMNAGSSITGGTAPFTGTYIPEGNFADFNGQNANGTWRLCITDDTRNDVGTFNTATITFGTPPPPPPPTVQDCEGAIPVCQNTYSQTNAFSGTGNYPNEINPAPSCLGAGERNDVWYMFTVQQSGNLCFSITPNVLTDDYDWAVFDISSNPCSDIYSNGAMEVSCNFSAASGVTGPNGQAGLQNEPCIAVTAGQTYVVNVSQFSTSTNGYTLNFGASTAVIFDNIPPQIQSVSQPIACGATSLAFDFTESILCSSIQSGDFTLTGPGGPYTLSGVAGPNCTSGGTQEDNFTINVSPPLTTAGNFQLCITNAAGSVQDLCGNVAPPGCLNFTITNGVVANAGPDLSLCAGGPAVTIGGAPTGSGGTAPLTYSWTPTTNLTTATSANPTAAPSTTQTYTVTVTDNLGCTATDAMTLTVTPAPVVTVTPASSTICYGSSVSLTASGAVTYTWSPTTGLAPTTGATVTASPTTTTTYTVTGSQAGCPNDTETATVTVLPQIIPNFTQSGNYCLATNSVNFTSTSTGQSGAATYSWAFTGGTPATATGANPTGITWAAAGTYNVTLTVTDGACSQQVTLPVTINPNPTVTATGTNPTCFGLTNGTINASGSSAGTYSWSSGQTTAGPHNVGIGTYTVTFTNGNGCIATNTVTLTEPALLTVTASATDATCFGVCNGTLSAGNAVGGTPGYTYAWNNGAGNGQNLSNICDGTYQVTVTDANNCTATASTTINEPTQLAITATGTNATCNSICDGSINTTTTGGTPGYSWSWTGGLSGEDPTGVCANGTPYTVTVTDANSCTATANVTITQPPALTVTASGTDVSCNGVCNGSLNAAAAGGTGAITYSWSGGLGAGAAKTNVCAGTYTVTATDANGCTATDTYTINEPIALTVTLSGNDASCNGICDGDVTATPAGGTSPYTYQWDAAGNLSTAANVTNVCAGNPGVTVTDANNCTTTGNFTINQPAAIVLTPSSNNSTCGASNGDVSVVAAGGTPGYTYSWTDATPVVVGTTSSVSSLPAGTYTVTVTDANSCISTTTATISDAGGGTATATVDNMVSCNGVCDGAATVTMTGGTPTFTYLWSNGATTSSVTGLCAGTYTVDVTDNIGCIASASVIITQPTALTIAITSSTPPTCNGVCDGIATATANGGTGTLDYSWNNSASITNSANDLCGGVLQTVTVTDDNNCTAQASVTLIEPILLTGTTTFVDPACNAACNGTIDLTPTGGTGVLSYLWNDAGASTSQDLSGLCAGTFNVTITDANGCTANATATLTDPNPLLLTPSGTDANCNQSDGQVCVNVAGGTGTITYSWSDAASQTTACASNVPAGTYTVNVLDANNCPATINVTINNLAGPTATANVISNVSGFGLCDGSVDIVPAGGTAPYTYVWDDPANQTTSTATGLCVGTYCATVTDVNGCAISACATLIQPDSMYVTIVGTDLSCNGNCIGAADATVTGGVAPYTFAWGSGANTEDLSSLCAGLYNLTVTDANGVTATGSVTIIQPTQVIINSITPTAVLCNGGCDGTINASASGGTGAITYTWNNGLPAGNSQNNVCPGNYTLTVTDANNCTATQNTTVSEPTALSLSTSSVNSNCGQANGQACVTIANGTAPYTQIWSDPTNQTSLCATNLSSGTYQVVVTDANGCKDSVTVNVNDVSGGTAGITINSQVSCNAACDAQATATMTGGTAPFTYSWSAGTTPSAISTGGLCAGNVTVTITDGDGCVSNASATITQPTALTTTSSGTNVSCFGSTNGSVTTTPTGGSSAVAYNYNWINQATSASVGTTPSVNNLAAGTYCVTVTDDNGCTVTDCVTLTAPNQIVVTTSNTPASCGQADGTIMVQSSTGGSGTYISETWVNSGGTAVADINAVIAGTYTVTVTDDQGCTGTGTATVSDLSGPTINIDNTSDALCNNTCTGSANVSVILGVSPYTYSWSPAPGSGQGTPNISSLCAGNYAITVTDSNGCIATSSVTINQPNAVQNTLVSTVDVSGFGVCDGEAVISTSGGSGTYSYSWFDDCGATTPNAALTGTAVTGLCANTYGAVATDANGCADTLCVTIIEPGAITVTVTTTPESCNGGCNGTATATASGGVGGFTYVWYQSPANTSIGQSAVTASNLCAGNYYVEVTDANGITQTSAVATVNTPAAITLTPSITTNFNGFDISCNGGCNGAATVSATGGTAPYSYLWSASAGNQSSQIASNLCVGTHNVTVTDANGCPSNASITLSEPTALTLSLTPANVNCFGACDGTITSTPAGGTPGYTYQWDNPSLSTTQNVSNLCPGTFNLDVTDANGCTISQSTNITQPADLVLNTSTTGSNCNLNDGTATVSVTSGVGPFTFLWDAAAANQTTNTASNLFSGCYQVVVTDANNCSDSITACVTDLGAPTVSILTQSDASCNGACDGFAQIQVSGGTPPLTYNWFDNTNTPIGQTTSSATNLCAGTYKGEMTDANGCKASINVVIGQPTPLTSSVTNVTAVSCFGLCNGSAKVIAGGGTAPYTYLWNDPVPQTTQTANNLCPGSYTATVTDANGCTSNATANISEPLQITISTGTTNAYCGTNTGTAYVTLITNGTAPYNYGWNDALTQSADSAINLIPGNYIVTVTDANGCIGTGSATVNNTPPGTATITNNTDVSCFGGANGSATVSMAGSGTAPYTYQWYNGAGISIGQTGITANNLPTGNFYAVVTDANGCIATSNTILINQPTQLSATTTTALTNCYGTCDGEAQAFPSGGTSPYGFLWNDGLNQTTQMAGNLCAGNYNVTVTDGNGCTTTTSATVTSPAAIQLDSTVFNANCGQADGSGCVIASGGTGPYTYLWPDNSTNSCHSGLVASTYAVTVTDVQGCTKQIAIEIQDLNGPTAQITSTTMVSCNGICDGQASVNMVGGTGNFTVLWSANSGAQTTPTASNLCAGLYTVTITDDVGCNASTNITISQPDTITLNAGFSNPICFGAANGTANVSTIGGSTPYSYQWLDGNNNPIGTNSNTISGLIAGSYQVTVTDNNGCVAFENYTLTNPAQPIISATGTDITCNANCNGSAVASGVVGAGTYTFQWGANSGNQTGAQATGLCPGTYTVTGTDGNGCTATATVAIAQPAILTVTTDTIRNVSCFGYSDGLVQVDVAGGTPNYTYSWTSGGGTQPFASNLASGSYSVTVTDANGCAKTHTVNVQQPTQMAATVNKTNVTCYNACNGTAGVVVSGGNPAYTYQWDNPTFSTTSNISNLCNGTYNCLITDNNGCQLTKTVNITQPLQVGANITITNSNCGQNNGQICTNAYGGVAPYVFNWNDPNTQTTACALNLLAGCYTLNITDGNGCNIDSLICIDDIAGPTVTVDTFSHVVCNGDDNGVVDFNATGGTGTLTLSWLDGSGNAIPAGAGTDVLANLDGGCYTLQVVDAAGCFSSKTQCISEPAQINSAIFNFSNGSCFMACNGSATVNVSGGISSQPYNFNWNNGQTTQTASNLCAGTHTVTVSDVNGCSSQSSILIAEPAQLTASVLSQTPALCNGQCNGAAQIQITGGTLPYLISWTPAISSSTTISNLCAGTYTCNITDGNGCTTSVTVNITEPAALNMTTNAVNATCSQCNGQGNVVATGGTTPYAFSWFGIGNSPTSSANTGICAGNYNIKVTDANNCTLTTSILILDEASPVIDGFITSSPSCNGATNGTVQVQVSGGTVGTGYNYQWNPAAASQVTQTAVGLGAGVYCVTVSDANGCTASDCINLTQPSPLVGIGDISTVICYGQGTQLWASGQGGTAPYTINWIDNQLTGGGPILVFPGVTTDFCFSVTDGNGCISPTSCITIGVTPPLSLTLTPDQEFCDGESVTVTAQGGAGNGGPYTFTWTDQNNIILNGNQTGNTSEINVTPFMDMVYTVELSDGCSTPVTASTNVTMNELPQALLFAPVQAGCAPFNAQLIANSDIGTTFEFDVDCDGSPEYSGSNTNFTYQYADPGVYDACLTVTSDDGCVTSIQQNGMITVYEVPEASFTLYPTETSMLSPLVELTDQSIGATNYSWNFGDGNVVSGPASTTVNDSMTTGPITNPSHDYSYAQPDTGWFTVTLVTTNDYGCLDTAYQNVHIVGDYIFFTPNSFTPNNDGENDVWLPKGIGVDVMNYKLLIFNRWGQQIFESSNPAVGWDGTYRGTMSQIDVYVWIIRTKDVFGKDHEYMGHVTLVR